MSQNKEKIAVVGLGYVGLPLAIELAKKFETIGYDNSKVRIEELNKGLDSTLELTKEDILSSSIALSNNPEKLNDCSCFIITVPTPINSDNSPDLQHIESATALVAKYIKKNDLVIYESTVYPGLTEEFCVPILEQISNLKFNEDFHCGYSPERINPGDKEHNLTDIVKVVSASSESATARVEGIYSAIVNAGTFVAESIKVAEMAKVIENTQRDLNIALINEFSQICKKLNIDTQDVLRAAETKWNFLPFRPGIVGGHCIGVDPYYLTHVCKTLGHKPEVILAGRKLNDKLPELIVREISDSIDSLGLSPKNINVLIMGVAFKENCPDYRNSGSLKLIYKLSDKGYSIDMFDPWIDSEKFTSEHGFQIEKYPKKIFTMSL